MGCIENCLNCQAQSVVINGITFSWRPVTGDVPQGMILGPVLFNIFISELDDGTERTLCKPANTKLEGVVDPLDGFAVVRWDLGVEKWASRNVVNFKGKCKVLSNSLSKN